MIPAGAFKQGCLALLDQVAAAQDELVITKRGKPVARLVPMRDAREHERALLERWRKGAKQNVSDEELLRPSSRLVDWHALQDGS